ncbi:MAG TPA: hypothetical protein VIY50_11345 [Steroidobacteraceae bacterium]
MARNNHQPCEAAHAASGAAEARSVVHAEFHLVRVYDSSVARVWDALGSSLA